MTSSRLHLVVPAACAEIAQRNRERTKRRQFVQIIFFRRFELVEEEEIVFVDISHDACKTIC